MQIFLRSRRSLAYFLFFVFGPALLGEYARANLFNGTGFYSEKQVQERGEVGTFQYLSGAVIGTAPTVWYLTGHGSGLKDLDITGLGLPEFGLGQFIQGRFMETGWIVAAGEGLSLGLINYGYYQGGGQDSSILYALAYFGFRCLEVYDLWLGTPAHNRAAKGMTVSITPLNQSGAMAILATQF